MRVTRMGWLRRGPRACEERGRGRGGDRTGERVAEKLVPGRLMGAEGMRPRRTRAWAGLGFRSYCSGSEGGEGPQGLGWELSKVGWTGRE